MYKFIIFILLLFSFQNIFAATDLDLKVYSSKIWLSKDKIFDGDKIRIYSEFQNQNDFDVKKTIQFFIDNNLIQEKKIEIAKKEKIIAWTDIIITAGNHKIISKTKEEFKDTPNDTKKISTEKQENLKEIKIDWDSDGDDIGDSIDPDDDNDGFPDILEVKEGSDPKSKTSTPESVAKEKTQRENQSIVSGILESLNQKRAALQKSIEEQKKNKEETIEQKEKEADKIKIEKKEKETTLIKKYRGHKDFQKEIEKAKKVFNDLNSVPEIQRKTDEEIEKILNSNEYQDKELPEAALIQARNEKIEEIKSEKEPSFWTKLSFYILAFLTFILKSLFWTIIFFIFLIWLLWKIIKKLF